MPHIAGFIHCVELRHYLASPTEKVGVPHYSDVAPDSKAVGQNTKITQYQKIVIIYAEIQRNLLIDLQ